MRQFFRHSTDIPIAVSVAKENTASSPLLNLSVGGLSCEVENFIAVGTLIDIHIPEVNPIYEGKGVVSWCQKKGDGFEIGVCFNEGEEVFRARMVEQICRMERYKSDVFNQEGRTLSTEEAANEWIDKYAASFDKEFRQD